MWVQSSWNANITRISNGHISLLLEATVTWSGMLVVLYVLHMLIWPWRDPRSRSRSMAFWGSENCTVLRHCGVELKTEGWLRQYGTLSTAFWSQISEFIFQLAVMWLPSSRNVDITRMVHSALPEARSLWLWLQVGRTSCARWRHDREPRSGAFWLNFLLRKLSLDFKLRRMLILHELQRAMFPYCFRLQSHGRVCW